MQESPLSQYPSKTNAERAGRDEARRVSAPSPPPPPTATIPALHFGPAEGRPVVLATSAPTSGGGSSVSDHPFNDVVERNAQWARLRSGTAAANQSLSGERVDCDDDDEDNNPGEAQVSDPPALRRSSALFDTALATEALFARLRQRQQDQEQQQKGDTLLSAAPPMPAQFARPMEGEPAAQRPPVSISSVLGRPPTAPFTSAALHEPSAASSSSPRRASLSFGARQRSASPSSTVDYVDIEHKQNELRCAVEHHIQSLERSLAMRDEEVATLTSRLRKLEEDYQFNYNLIAERDAALEEASAQLQRLYRELKRLTEEATRTGKKVDVAETELRAARQRVREVEEERDAAVRQVQKDYAIKERHLLDGLRAKESALEQEQQEQHQWYKEQARLLEEERTALADRSVSISVDAEERCKLQVGRLQDELAGLQRELKAARQTKTDDDRQNAILQEAKAALLHEIEVAERRHEAAVQELTLAKKEVEERVVRVTADAEKRIAAAESATREENARASCLGLERTRLQATLAETQERLQHLTSQFDDEVARYTKERQTLLKRTDDAVAATAVVEQSLQDTQRELDKQRRLAAEEAERLGRELERSRVACDDTRQQLVIAQERSEKWEAAAERLEAEVRRWKSEEDKTATSGRQERSAWEERCRVAERQVQLLQEEAQQAARVQQGMVEKAQGETARLTRELHASEAARRTLEDQFHLLEDCKEERGAVQTLRMEKEQLQRRVGELEHTNEEVRQQVAAFTAELQNDPILKAAKESQQRLVELQQELNEARAEQQLLRDAVKEKEDEVVRCHTEMLRVQVLVGDEPSAAINASPAASGDNNNNNKADHLHTASVGLSDQVSRALQRQQQQMRSEYSKMRQSYQEMVHELDRRRRRHRKHRASASAAAHVSRSSSASSSTSSSLTLSSRGERKDAKRSHRQKRNDADGGIEKPTTPLPPALPDSKTAFVAQEMEVWRQRCVQLEQQLHAVLRERDRLKKELQLAKQDVVALGTEKQSLIDLNSLLKAQLREAYRLHGGDAARSSSAAESLPTTKSAQMSPEVLAAAVQALRRGIEVTTQATPQTAGAMQGEATEGRTTPHTRDTPVVHSTQGFHPPGRTQPTPTPSASAGGFSAQAAQERLAALEREIDDVRGQLSSAVASAPPTRQPVVRRGNAAVRHYGYHNN